ncbi:5-methyltetrahydropteroyltriglutamate--homocysteine methyltransferase [Bacillus sp. J14TS2]|uniref:5-methyltetrahydropteroyltriglutamate-- homocysteine S-methyltransferase n=1 Tax=Bacillus sp. J14TS2 TaxID=2807188 RepID=UPI001B23F5B7|nr:5-methyltetrahydropteroyltriglutamate--homocysteine S-methyltransferase [Bacillus sp. J14TS2]GIN69542.1 5-methyltetrahydropteroyltriglutamate--homocysteine methyltransferase [Bacillus sp. J14TS2]
MARHLPLKADHVGSFLRTGPLKEARASYRAGNLSQVALRLVEDQEIEKLIKKQIDVGLKAITDGEFRRAWFMHDFFWGLEGVEYTKREGGIAFKGETTSADSYKVTGKIRFGAHYMIQDFAYLKRKVDEHGDGSQLAKVTIPSPSQMLYRIPSDQEKELYPNLHDLFEDLAIAYQETVQKFYEAGCRYLQLDDTVLSALADPEFPHFLEKISGLKIDELVALLVKTIQVALKDKPEDMIVATHMCKGNFKSTYLYEGGYEQVAKFFDQLPYDSYFLEYDDERSGGFEPLQEIINKDITVVLGLISSKNGELEDKEAIIQRIKEASQSISLDQLALSPQCGFSSTEEGANNLTEEEQWNKIKHVIEIAEVVWGKVPVQ